MLSATNLFEELDRDGIVLMPKFVHGKPLADMQRAMAAKLTTIRANNVDGFEKTERYRDMVEDVLLLDQGFLNLAVDPLICDVVRSYVGPKFQLVEAKAWRSLPTTKDFHGWHGDSWYDQTKVYGLIPREIKLGFYLTDVNSGGLAYVRGSHRRVVPKLHRPNEVSANNADVLSIVGPAGTVVLFDTSGIHRQSMPVIERRHAAFFCYHDPDVPLQTEDVAYNRYHPLLLNAAFLGGLSDEQQRVLGFGDCRNFIPGYTRKVSYPFAHRMFSWSMRMSMLVNEWSEPVRRRIARFY